MKSIERLGSNIRREGGRTVPCGCGWFGMIGGRRLEFVQICSKEEDNFMMGRGAGRAEEEFRRMIGKASRSNGVVK